MDSIVDNQGGTGVGKGKLSYDMNIYVFGNPDVENDSLPLRTLPALRERFSDINFIPADPNELGLAPENPWWILDTVKGIERVTVFEDPSRIRVSRRVSLHDYDLGMHLALLVKAEPNLQIRIIGVPQGMGEKEALEGIARILEGAGAR